MYIFARVWDNFLFFILLGWRTPYLITGQSCSPLHYSLSFFLSLSLPVKPRLSHLGPKKLPRTGASLFISVPNSGKNRIPVCGWSVSTKFYYSQITHTAHISLCCNEKKKFELKDACALAFFLSSYVRKSNLVADSASSFFFSLVICTGREVIRDFTTRWVDLSRKECD